LHLEQGCASIGHQVAVPNICGSSVWNLVLVNLLAPRSLRWLLVFWKICTSKVDGVLLHIT